MVHMDKYLVGVRLRATAQADDYRVGDLELHVGDLVLVETAAESAVGEVRRAKRELPEAKKDRLYRRGVRTGTEAGGRGDRGHPGRGGRGVDTAPRAARRRGVRMKIRDGEMHPVARRGAGHFKSPGS